MINFDDVRLPVDIEQGAKGGPTFFTTVITNTLGREQRNRNWLNQRMSYDIAYGIQNVDDYNRVVAFFYARLGRLRAFRFKDWADYQAFNERIGTGDGNNTHFQLVKTYDDAVNPYQRRITRPVVGTVIIYVDNQPASYTLGDLGEITLGAAPPPSSKVAWSGEFDVPVRFENDDLELASPTQLTATIDQIKLRELPE